MLRIHQKKYAVLPTRQVCSALTSLAGLFSLQKQAKEKCSVIFITSLSTILLILPVAAYEVKNFQNLKDLQMGRESTVRIYLLQNKKKQYSVEVFSAWVLKDSYYKEILLPISAFKKIKKEFTVCSVGKPIFIGEASHDYSHRILKQCQSLAVRTKDSQYIYAGYVIPTDRVK
jgi:hypothetical protein